MGRATITTHHRSMFGIVEFCGDTVRLQFNGAARRREQEGIGQRANIFNPDLWNREIISHQFVLTGIV